MTFCDLCQQEKPDTQAVGMVGVTRALCPRCRCHWQGLLAEVERDILAPYIFRSIHEQRHYLVVPYADFEDCRRMDKSEFRNLVRQRLQAFGDQILAHWETVKR